MKKIFFALCFLISLNAISQAIVFPVNSTNGSKKSTNLTLGVAASDSGYQLRTNYPDTLSLNIGQIKYVPGLMVRVGTDIYIRNDATTAWVKVNGSSGSTPNLQQVLTAGSTIGNNTISSSGTFELTAVNELVLNAGDGVILQSGIGSLGVRGDSIVLAPPLGKLNIDSIRTLAAGDDEMMTWNPRTGVVSHQAIPTSGSSSIRAIPQDSVYDQNTFSEQSSWINTNIFQLQTSSFFAGGYRDGASVLTVSGPSGDSIYFYGGWTSPSTVYDSVYYSIDGGITKTYVGLAPWGAMHSFAMFKADNGYYYKIGGDYLSTNAQKLGVWRTTTPGVMASWTQVGTLPSRGRILFDAIELNGTLYTGGGQYTVNWSDGATDTIWKSVDNGANWTYHSSGSGHFDKNISHTWVKREGRVYQVAGGQYDEATPGNRTYDKTVISTDDFITYRVEESIPSAGVQYPSVVLWDSKIWCIGGAVPTNVNNVNYLDKGGRWHVAANYDSTATAATATHAAAITTWKDRIVLMNGNDFNKTYWINRSRFITGENDIEFMTKVKVDTLTGNASSGVLSFGSKYSGSYQEYFKINAASNRAEVAKQLLVNSNMIVGSTASASNYINFRNSNDALGYIEYANTGYDIYWNNNMYWRFMNDGSMRFKEIASGGTPGSTYGAIYVKTDNNLYFKNDAGTEYQISGAGSSGITVGTTTITGGTTTNIPYNSSGVYQESTNMQWDNTNQLIQTGRGFRVKSGYTFLTETGSNLSTILGNSVKRSATNGEVEKTSVDPGSYVRLNYQDGMTFHTNFIGAISTSVAEANNQAAGIDLSKNFYVGDKTNKQLTVNSSGKITKYGNAVPADLDILLGSTSSGAIEKGTVKAADFNVSANELQLDYTNGQKATASQPGFMTAAQAARLDSNTTFVGDQGIDITQPDAATVNFKIKAFQIWDSDTATTTNNTITTVTTITCPNDGAGVLTVTMVGVKTDGTKYLTGEKKIQWTSSGGTVTLRYTTEVAADYLTGFSTATWTVDASGGTLRIRVTGEATENVQWSPSFIMKYHSVAL